MSDAYATDKTADLRNVLVHDTNDVEATLGDAREVGEGLTQVARTNDDDGP